jgi:hypothetical protein
MEIVVKTTITRSTNIVPLKTHLLWVDGVLSQEQLSALQAQKKFIRGSQSPTYYVAELSGYVDGMSLRTFLDPNIFILQIDDKALMLELNFNPTPAQMIKLRNLKSAIHKHLESNLERK